MKHIALSEPKPVLLDWKRRSGRNERGGATRFSPELVGMLVRLEAGPMIGDDPVSEDEDSSNPDGSVTPFSND